MKRGATSPSDQKLKKAREYAELKYAWQPHVILVNHMMRLDELFKLSMSENNELSEYLSQNPAHLSNMNKISKDLQVVIDNDMDEFIIALMHMVNSKGYSMIKFLESDPDAVDFLQRQLPQLDKIYFGFLLYRKSKILAELQALASDSDESSELENENTDYLPYSLLHSTVSVDVSDDSPSKIKFKRQSNQKK